MTAYPQAVFERVPAEVLSWWDILPPLPGESKPEQGYSETPELSGYALEALLRWLSEDETPSLINAELNYSLHAIQIVRDDRARALRLIELIDGVSLS